MKVLVLVFWLRMGASDTCDPQRGSDGGTDNGLASTLSHCLRNRSGWLTMAAGLLPPPS